MKKIFSGAGLFVCLATLFLSCKKDEKEPPDETGWYYFNFKANENSYNFNSDLPAYPEVNTYLLGGFQMANNTNKPNISLLLQYDHNPTDGEVLSLSGKTFYFDGSFPKPIISFDGGAMSGAEQYESIDTLSSSYNVKINSVSYKRTDTVDMNIVDVYVINGTCKAYLRNKQNDNLYLNVTDGNFNFLVSRIKE